MKKKVAVTILVGILLGIGIFFRNDKKELINITKNENNTLAFFVEENDSYTEATTMPTGNYKLNEEKSFCTNNAKPTWNNEINALEIMSLDASNTNCYLYFDEACKGACKIILANVTVNEGTPDFSKTAQATCSSTSNCETTNGVYKAKDDDGTSYYFRGAVDNNYVKFANKYWRIIRINGDGSIRMIYDGTSAHVNGTSTSDSIAVASQSFNSSANNNAYVGFKYTLGELRGLETKSRALTMLEGWYQNNLSSYASKIDTDTGFCGDRTPSTSSSSINNSGGTSTVTTYYGGYIRLYTNKSPILTCADANDLYTVSSSNKGNKTLTYPIGLITADEVSMVGGVHGKENQSYYLYNGQSYWTLSPYDFEFPYSGVFYVSPNGVLARVNVYVTTLGIRPVINLRADTKFTFTGTGEKGSMTNPYIVEGGN